MDSEKLQKELFDKIMAQYEMHYGDQWSQRFRSEFVNKYLFRELSLSGKAVLEACTEHQISQAQYYQWRQLFTHAGQAFEVHQQSQRETRLHQENARLKQLVGELTLELKKKATSSGNDAAVVSLSGRSKYSTPGSDRSAQGRASVLGLSPVLGVSPIHGWARRE